MKSLFLRVITSLAGIVVAGLVGLGLSTWALQFFSQSPITTTVFARALFTYYVLAPSAMSLIAVLLPRIIPNNRHYRSLGVALATGIPTALFAYAAQAFGASAFNLDLYPQRGPVMLHESIRLTALLGSATLLAKQAVKKARQ